MMPIVLKIMLKISRFNHQENNNHVNILYQELFDLIYATHDCYCSGESDPDLYLYEIWLKMKVKSYV